MRRAGHGEWYARSRQQRLIGIYFKAGGLQLSQYPHFPPVVFVQRNIEHAVVVRRFLNVTLYQRTDVFSTQPSNEVSEFEDDILSCAGSEVSLLLFERTHIIRRK